MSELDVFVDESGDFGGYDSKCPCYLLTFVIHNKEMNFNDQFNTFSNRLNEIIGKPDHCLHVGPLIRRETVYKKLSISTRRKILNSGMGLLRNIEIKYKTFSIAKNINDTRIALKKNLYNQICSFIEKNISYLNIYQKINIYYDNGQKEITEILKSAFLSFNYEFKNKKPNQKRLLQMADLICTFELFDFKNSLNYDMTNSEKIFFGNYRNFKSTYLKSVRKKLF